MGIYVPMSSVLVMSPEEARELVRSVIREELQKQPQAAPEVLTAERVGEMLGVHPKTVAKLVTRDRLPARRLGREYRFKRDEVVSWLEQRAINPGAHTSAHAAKLQTLRVA